MGAMKNKLILDMERLSRESGYSEDFLFDKYFELMDDPDEDHSWDTFARITMEQDW